jgi:hypothetical protein
MDDLKNTVMAPAAEQPLTTTAAKVAGPDKQTKEILNNVLEFCYNLLRK